MTHPHACRVQENRRTLRNRINYCWDAIERHDESAAEIGYAEALERMHHGYGTIALQEEMKALRNVLA